MFFQIERSLIGDIQGKFSIDRAREYSPIAGNTSDHIPTEPAAFRVHAPAL